jgi:hypothetical protein
MAYESAAPGLPAAALEAPRRQPGDRWRAQDTRMEGVAECPLRKLFGRAVWNKATPCLPVPSDESTANATRTAVIARLSTGRPRIAGPP